VKILLFVIFIFGGLCINSQIIKNKHFKKAEKAYYNEDYTKAKSLYLKAIEEISDCSLCYAQLANIYNIESNFESAFEQINIAIKYEELNNNNSGNLGFYFSIRSFVQFNLNDLNQAQEDISNAIKLEPNNDNYFFMRSLMRRMDGDIDGCCSDLVSAQNLGNKKAENYLSIYCSK
jgi:tetratricopeptide (TPR) repeat protein